MLAIIGGSGLTRLSTLAVAHREVVRTPWGEPSSALLFGQIAGRDAVFLARHGHGHTIPPHRVNYRANLWALKDRGATAVLAVASVGGIRGAPARGAGPPAPADRLHARSRVDVLRRRRRQGRPRRFHPPVHAGAARDLPRRGRRRGHRARRRRRLRRGVGTAPGDGRGDRPDGARRRDAGRHDRHARGRARARARACRTRRSASSSITPPAAATRRWRSRWPASPRCWKRGWRRSGAARPRRAEDLNVREAGSDPRHPAHGRPAAAAAGGAGDRVRHPGTRARCWPTCATRWPRPTAPGSPRRRSACRCRW